MTQPQETSEGETSLWENLRLTVELKPEHYVPVDGQRKWLDEHGVLPPSTRITYVVTSEELAECFPDVLTAVGSVYVDNGLFYLLKRYLRSHAIEIARMRSGRSLVVGKPTVSALLHEYRWQGIAKNRLVWGTFGLTFVGGEVLLAAVSDSVAGKAWVAWALGISTVLFFTVSARAVSRGLLTARAVAIKWRLATGQLRYPWEGSYHRSSLIQNN